MEYDVAFAVLSLASRFSQPSPSKEFHSSKPAKIAQSNSTAHADPKMILRFYETPELFNDVPQKLKIQLTQLACDVYEAADGSYNLLILTSEFVKASTSMLTVR